MNINWKSVCRYSVMSKEKLSALAEQAALTAHLHGEAAELGSYKGGSAILLAQVLKYKTVHAFESFDGLTNLSEHDRIRKHSNERGHAFGDFAVTSGTERAKIRKRLNQYGVKLHEGNFSDQVTSIERDMFCFVHFDGDTYESTRECLSFFLPRMVVGGRLVIDDYGSIATPGVAQAVSEFSDRIETMSTGQAVLLSKTQKTL